MLALLDLEMSHDDEFARASFARFCAARCRGDRRLTTVSGQAARLLRIPRSWSRARFRSVAHSRPYCDVIASIVLIALFLLRFFHFIYSVDNSRPARTFVSLLSFLSLFFFFVGSIGPRSLKLLRCTALTIPMTSSSARRTT